MNITALVLLWTGRDDARSAVEIHLLCRGTDPDVTLADVAEELNALADRGEVTRSTWKHDAMGTAEVTLYRRAFPR